MNHNNQQPGSADLLPCPFCGSAPELVDDRTEWFVRCKGCGPIATVIYGRSVRNLDHSGAQSDWDAVDWQGLKQSAIDAWNRRYAIAASRPSAVMGRAIELGFDVPLPDVAMPEQHTDDIAVDRFAAAMKEKMAKSRAKGRAGWDDPAQCSIHTLQAMLIDHLAKGDPVDVGNFAMMLFIRDGRTCAVPEGFALVPTMYTTAMRKAWDSGPLTDDDDSDFARGYAAMVAAAPKPGEMPRYVTCGACDGTGYYASGSTDICEDCNGAGEVEATTKEWS